MSNLARRILFSVLAIPFVMVVSYLGGWYLWALTLFIIEIAWWEYCSILKKRGFYSRAALVGHVWIALLFVKTFQPVGIWINTQALILLLAVVGCLSELYLKDMGFSISRMAVQLFGAIYIGLTGYSVFLVSTLSYPAWKIFIPFLLSIWISDTLAYFTGRLIGRHLLYPAVSPKKTIEGSIAGIVGSLLGFSTYLIWTDTILLPHIIIIGLGIAIVGQFGDLFESMIKRWAGVKDSSGLFPGHGGVLDRIDSLLLAAPFVVFYFRYVIT